MMDGTMCNFLLEKACNILMLSFYIAGISFMLSKVDLTKIRLLPITDESPKYQFYDEYGILTVHRDEICSRVFDPVVKEVILLIENQIRNANSKIDTTYLLGGFGNSPYLMRRIREHFSENEAGEITNSKSNDSPGELAAMRGAIYYGLDSLRSTQLTSIETVRFKDQRFNPNDFSILLCFGKSKRSFSLSNSNMNFNMYILRYWV